MDKTLAAEITKLSTDLATHSVFSLGSDLPVVGDALKRTVAILTSLDARVTALEKASGKAPSAPGVIGPNIGSPVPPGAQA